MAGAGSVLDAVLLVAGAWLLASVVAELVAGAGFAAVAGMVTILFLILCGRAGLGALSATLPRRAAAAVKQELRGQIVAAAMAVRARPAAARTSTGEVTAIAGTGLDALDPYFARYLPEMIRAATVPLVVLVALFATDLVSGTIVLVTLPLIPLFGALVGRYTQHRTRRQWRALAVLSHHFLDVVSGLPTLKVFGRAKAQAATIATVTERHRVATMATLRVAMLSALVLELAATLSVALVAVSVGLRLVHGGLTLQVGLFLLILAPEAYLPWRRAAAEFHAAADGIAAAERGFGVIDSAAPAGPAGAGLTGAALMPVRLDRVSVQFPNRDRPALTDLDLTVPAGRVTAVLGPSGSGKSTLLRVVLGLQATDTGRVRVGAHDLSTLDLSAWHRRVAWLPQRPFLAAGSVAENIRLGRPHTSDAQVQAAARAAGADRFISELPDGYATALADDGTGLSAGQRQRLALARVFLRTDADVVLLDEPTAHLDLATETAVVAALQGHLAGRTAIVVTHRPALLDLADRVVDLSPSAVLR